MHLDRGLAMLQQRTDNTRLLKRPDGGEIIVRRFANLGPDTLALNLGDGRIDVSDMTFDYPTGTSRGR